MGATDVEILRYSRSEGRVFITLDHDFHVHLALSGSTGPSVVFIRVEALKAVGQAALILEVWEKFEGELDSGVAVSVDSRNMRARKLPLFTSGTS